MRSLHASRCELSREDWPNGCWSSLLLRLINEHGEEPMRQLYLITLAACLLLITGGLATRATAAPVDDDFVMKAARGGEMEVELGRLAIRKGRSMAVKSFGHRMVTDHTAAGNKLKMIAAKKHITLPADMDTEGQEAMQRLSALSGSAFDRAYVEMMVTDHEKAIADFEMEISRRYRQKHQSLCHKDAANLKDAFATCTCGRGKSEMTAVTELWQVSEKLDSVSRPNKICATLTAEVYLPISPLRSFIYSLSQLRADGASRRD